MEHAHLERRAEDAYARAGLPMDATRTALELADALLGGGSRTAVFDVANLDTPAVIQRGRRGDCLLICSGLSEREAEWFGARALAGWMLRGLESTAADAEFLAACLRSPAPAVRSVAQHVGLDCAALADVLEVGEASALLRIGEVFGVRVVMHTPGGPVKIRGRGKPLRWCRMRLSGDAERVALVGR